MCDGSYCQRDLAGLLRDPLIRLAMNSDGVTDQAIIELINQVRRSLEAHKSHAGTRSLQPRSRGRMGAMSSGQH